MTGRDVVDEYAYSNDAEILVADGLDDAILGVDTENPGGPRAVYSTSKVLKILMERDGMSWIDAEEFFSFNISGAYMGPTTPLWIHDEGVSV